MFVVAMGRGAQMDRAYSDIDCDLYEDAMRLG
jgi:hypothetical protein